MYKKNAGLGETAIDRFLGSAERIWSLLSYWIFPKTAIPVVRTTVQCMALLEIHTESMKD